MHQPQARGRLHALYPSFLQSPGCAPPPQPPPLLTIPHFKCFSCQDAPLVLSLHFSPSLSLFFFFHEVTLPTHSSFSLPFSLSPALHLTRRQRCSHNVTLPLQALPVTCSPLNPCSPEKAGGRFGFPFPSRGQSLLDYFHTQKHTPRRGAKGVCVFSGQPT